MDEAVLARRIRAIVLRVVDAVRVIGAVEIEVVEPGGGAIEIEVAAADVGLGAVGRIAERHEQPLHRPVVGFDEGGERERLALDREAELTGAAHLAPLAGRRRHLDAPVSPGAGASLAGTW